MERLSAIRSRDGAIGHGPADPHLHPWHGGETSLGDGKVLVEAIELKTRVKLAHRLAADPATPAVLIRAPVLNENRGAVQIIAKAAGCSWATAKALLLMTVAERKMSKADLEHARVNFEQLERRTRILRRPPPSARA